LGGHVTIIKILQWIISRKPQGIKLPKVPQRLYVRFVLISMFIIKALKIKSISLTLDWNPLNTCFCPSLTFLKASSTKGIKKLSSADRAKLVLPNETKEILIGILLGGM